MKQETKHELPPLVRRLYELAENQDRGALAALRRGAGKDPGTDPATFPYVVPFLPARNDNLDPWPYFCVASLFALNPRVANRGFGFGDAFRQLRESDSRDVRFRSVLNAHEDDLPKLLRQAVRQLAAKDPPVPLDWEQLLRDLRGWSHPDKYVQRKWAQQYWAPRATDADSDNQE